MRCFPFRQQRFFALNANHLQRFPVATTATTTSHLRSCSLAFRAPHWCFKWSATKYSSPSSFLPWTILSANSFVQFRHSSSTTSTSGGSDDQSSTNEAKTVNNNSQQQQQQQQKRQDIDSSRSDRIKYERERATVLDLITLETIKNLRPGNTIRHTHAPPYGVRADGAVFEELEEILFRFRKGTKEYLPLITFVNSPLQGGTAFLDAIGYNPQTVAAFGDSSPDLSRTFVFNVSMNSKWQIDENKIYSIREAQDEISFRIIATAAGMTSPQDPGAETIRTFLKHNKEYVGDVVSSITHRIWKLTGSHEFYCFFLFDAFTNLVDCLDKNEVIQLPREQLTAAQALSCSFTSLIGERSVVVVSGFTGIKVKLSASDRNIMHLALPPLTSAQERRGMLVMKTKFFQRVADADLEYQKKVIYYYELCKSSRGVFGALLEKLDDITAKLNSPAATSSTLFSILENLPIIQTILDNKSKQCRSGATESPFTAMNNILEWKSVQFCSELSDDDSLRRQMEAECRDAEQLKVAQVPHGTLVSIPRFADGSSIIDVRLHPICFSVLYNRAAATVNPRSFFAVFNHMLKQYSYCFTAVDDLKENKLLLQELMLKRWIGGPITSSFVVGCSNEISDFVNERCKTQVLSSANPTLDSISLTSVGELNAKFFEDAIAVGIAFVFELRQRLVNRCKIEQPIVATMKEFFISKTTKSVFGSTDVAFATPLFTLKQNGRDPEPQIEWTQPHDAPIDPIRIIDFDREFPSNGDPSTNLPPFTHRSIFRPVYPKSSPLADVVYHEMIHSDGASRSRSPRLLQVWVDAKHTSKNPAQKKGEQPNEIGNKFAKLVSKCLQDPRLQDETCVVDHIVHIIVSPFVISDARSASISALLSKQVKSLGRLKSYTLYVISPDSVAFENLVSQPIALSIPLMEQQYPGSWTTKLQSSGICCYGYKGTQIENVGSQLESFEDARDWMRFRYDDDCVSTFFNLFKSFDQANESMSAHFSNIPLQLPFGSILEGLKIRPLSWYNGRYHQKYDVSFDFTSSNSATTATGVMTIGVFDDAVGKNHHQVPAGRELAVLLCSNIRVGHLLYDKRYDDKVWKALFGASGSTNNNTNKNKNKNNNTDNAKVNDERENAAKRWNQTLLDWHAEQRARTSDGIDDAIAQAMKQRLKQLKHVEQLLSFL